jgi:hypothetical protein
MATEPTAQDAPTDSGNGAPTPEAPTTDVADVRKAAIAAGLQVFDSSEMHGLKSGERAKAEAEAAQMSVTLKSLQAEHAKLTEWKSQQDNQGKSEAELHREQFRAWQENDKAKDADIKAASKANEGLQKQLELERVQNRISILMPDANSPEMALMWAKDKVGKLLSTNDAGDLVWTEPSGIPHEGIAAAQKFQEWYALDGQKHLRSSNAPGPVTSGAPSAPSAAAPQRPTVSPGRSSMDNYLAGEDWDNQQKGKQ